MNRKKTLLICVGILLAGGGITAFIFSTEPTATRSGATRQTAMLVDITEVQRDNFRPTIQVMGTVRPSQDITLRPQVSGQIVDRSANFTPGGYAEKGDTLLQIEPADYRNALQQRQSALEQARADLNIEQGRQYVAQQDFELLSDSLVPQNKSLVLRQPQLQSARSQVQSAEAAVEQARLNLQRTTIQAPFDAHILSRNVNVGSQVAVGDELGNLVGLEEYWVEVTVPQSHLRWLSFPGDGEQGSEVTIRNSTAWTSGEHRTGHLFKLVGSIEGQTRMARVLVAVPDPLSYRNENEDQPSLMIGSFVEANILAEEIGDVIRLNRDYVRQNDTVWIMEDEQLRISDLNIVFRDAQYAYIDSGLTEQDSVVTTNLSTVEDGAPLRLEGQAPADTTSASPSVE